MKQLRTVMARIGISAMIVGGTMSVSAPPAAAAAATVSWNGGYNMSLSKCQKLGKWEMAHYNRSSYGCVRQDPYEGSEAEYMYLVNANCAARFADIDGNNPSCNFVHGDYKLVLFD
ncbi:hypothetical protein ACFQ6O_44685 [Streptomyces sp. NPDC056441]|uniref:hypothetical protein n=1 Tax=unclassified Streptomyces TaxID=2593676 RepID=UPI0036ADA86C